MIDHFVLSDGTIEKYDYNGLVNKPESDETLSVEGGFADAKKVGDAVRDEASARASADTELSGDISDLNTALSQEASARANEIAVERARIDAFTQLPSGSTTGDAELIDARVGADGVTYTNLGSAVRNQLSGITEHTRNLNASPMGRWGNASDGKIYARDNTHWGMEYFIPVAEGESYTISSGGLTASSAISTTVLFVDGSGTVVNRQGYKNSNTRTVTAPTGATKLNVFFHASSGDLTISSDSYLQIEKSTIATNYIQPISAVDLILRSEINEYPTYLFHSVIGAIIANAEDYFDHAYNDENNLVYDSLHGLFSLQTTSDNEGEEGHPSIVCSQFVQAMMKYIKWENSRYVKATNHVGQYCFTSDGVNQDTQDGEPYSVSYYQYQNNMPYDANDTPSYDYMQSSELYRYALNHGFAYEIKERYPQLRPGDVVFSTKDDSTFFKKITHCAFCVYTGFDDGRAVLLESNTFTFRDKTNVGVGVRNSPLSANRYGARFPLHELPHTAKLVEHGSTFSVASTSTYNVDTLFHRKHDKGFYTVLITGSMPHSATPQVGVTFDGDANKTYHRLVCNGNLLIGFFYAPVSFDSVTLAINTGSNVTVEQATLVKGYVPLT